MCYTNSEMNGGGTGGCDTTQLSSTFVRKGRENKFWAKINIKKKEGFGFLCSIFFEYAKRIVQLLLE
jgi:hypothetical protein